MLIKDWMSKTPVTVKPATSIMKAAKLMKENGYHRLPVVDDDDTLVGIVSDRDIKEASPSKATTLDMHELYYLLSEIKIGDIMTKNVVAVTPEDTVEKAAVLLLRHNVGGLPVVDGENKVVGVITDSDIFKVLVSITGVLSGGIQFALDLPNVSGSLKTVLDDLKGHDVRIISILTSYDDATPDRRTVYIRVHPMDDAKAKALIERLGANHHLLYWAKDNF
ncbi:CBS and ACT domain-containing protein [Solidesulfovibrio alcoholivorans]|uniref:CBS and ACT domain-containing protein n=1 Tax=Solidesulfovibrio alcoholivorans TaxID=81406 RepID=UPI00049533C8|nr:CBS and ACT domain-containing protein [Solidesulfovibrio alcoholivorans]